MFENVIRGTAIVLPRRGVRLLAWLRGRSCFPKAASSDCEVGVGRIRGVGRVGAPFPLPGEFVGPEHIVEIDGHDLRAVAGGPEKTVSVGEHPAKQSVELRGSSLGFS